MKLINDDCLSAMTTLPDASIDMVMCDLPYGTTAFVEGREAKVHRMPPGPDRWKNRSRTYQGIADAMAQQWGNVC